MGKNGRTTLDRERRRHYRFMHRIYGMLNSGEWQIVYLKLDGEKKICAQLGHSSSVVGSLDLVNQRIYIDYRHDVIATLVHECLHFLIGERYAAGEEAKEEKEVRRLEKLMMRHMSRTQANRLHWLSANFLAKEKPRPL